MHVEAVVSLVAFTRGSVTSLERGLFGVFSSR